MQGLDKLINCMRTGSVICKSQTHCLNVWNWTMALVLTAKLQTIWNSASMNWWLNSSGANQGNDICESSSNFAHAVSWFWLFGRTRLAEKTSLGWAGRLYDPYTTVAHCQRASTSFCKRRCSTEHFLPPALATFCEGDKCLSSTITIYNYKTISVKNMKLLISE